MATNRSESDKRMPLQQGKRVIPTGGKGHAGLFLPLGLAAGRHQSDSGGAERATATVRPRGISPAGPGRLPVDTARPPRLGRERGFREPDALGSAGVGRLQARLGVGGG
jgi:hypothetical protein